MSTFFGDFRYAVRGLAKNRGFTAVALLVLAFGIGANTAIFSVVNAVLLRPLPFDKAGRLVEISQTEGEREWSVSYPDYVDWRQQARAFDEMAASSNWPATRTGEGEAERIEISFVSDNFFRTLGVAPALGRDFAPDDNRQSAPPVAIVSHPYWRNTLGGDQFALGRTLILDGRGYTIVGILSPAFRYHRAADVYVPFAPGGALHGLFRDALAAARGQFARDLHTAVNPVVFVGMVVGVGQIPDVLFEIAVVHAAPPLISRLASRPPAIFAYCSPLRYNGVVP